MLLHHLRQDEARERLGHRPDFEHRVGLGRTVAQDAPHAVRNDAERDSASRRRREIAAGQRRRQIGVQYRSDLVDVHRRHGRVERDLRWLDGPCLSRKDEGQRRSVLRPGAVYGVPVGRDGTGQRAVNRGYFERERRCRDDHVCRTRSRLRAGPGCRASSLAGSARNRGAAEAAGPCLPGGAFRARCRSSRGSPAARRAEAPQGAHGRAQPVAA